MANKLVKIEIRTEDGDVETPWAEALGGNLHRLDNMPFFAYGVSVDDVVEAIVEVEGEFPVYRRVVKRSGNRTVRVILKPPANKSTASMAVLDRLRTLGCLYEGANSGYIVVTVPPHVSLSEVCDYLTSTCQHWEHADPTFESLHAAAP